MWPRTDATVGPGSDMTASRRTKNTGFSGFVSFMKRRDAERALREFDGYDWSGSVLRVGWSKAVPLAAKAMCGAYGIWTTAYPKLIAASSIRQTPPEESKSESQPIADKEISLLEVFKRLAKSYSFAFPGPSI